MEQTEEREERTGVSRRRVVAGIAWSVPAIIVASALPAYAASTTQLTVYVAGFTGGTAPVAMLDFETSDISPVKTGTTATFTVIATRPAGVTTLDGGVDTMEGVYTTVEHGISGEVDTFTIVVQITSDRPSELSIPFTLNKTVASASAAVTDATAAPANGSVIFTSKPYDMG